MVSPNITMVTIYHFDESKNRFDDLDLQNRDCYKLLFFETEGWYTLENKKISTTPGDLFFLDWSNKLRDLKELSGSGRLVVLEVEALIEALMAQQCKTDTLSQANKSLSLLSLFKFEEEKIESFHIPQMEQSKWLVWLSCLEEELNNSNCYSASATRAILKLLLIELIRLFAKKSEKRFPHSDPLLNRVFDFIESNYWKAISLSDVAKEVNKSTSYLTNIVRQKTGKTVLQWIIEFRMGKARYLLLETDWSVEKIAEAVGYLDIRHFSRQFCRIHGSSPKKWQTLHLKHSIFNGGVNKQEEFLLPYHKNKSNIVQQCCTSSTLKN